MDATDDKLARLIAELAGPDASGRPFVALVSPSVRTALPADYDRLNAVLAAAGALAVHPVDAGIPEFARRSAAAGASAGGLSILSACPMALRFVAERYPARAASILGVPSPMALLAESAIAEAGISGRGYAIAITPCSHKRLEAASATVDLRVIELDRLLSALDATGIAIAGFDKRPYDTAPWSTGPECSIAETVVEETAALGIAGRSVKLDGAEAVDRFFSQRDAAAEAARDRGCLGERDGILFAEITFCEGGCGRGNNDAF